MPDRVPVSPFLQEEYLSFYFGRKCSDRLTDGVECAKELGIDYIAKDNKYLKPFFLKKSSTNWTVSFTEKVENNTYRLITEIETPAKTLRQIEAAPYIPDSLTGIHFSTHKYLIEDESDFEALTKYMPKTESEDLTVIREGGKRAYTVLGQNGISCPWSTGSVYNFASSFINVQDMMTDSKCEEEYYKEYMTFFASLVAEQNAIMSESLFDAIGVQGNIANGAMIGPEYFDEYILPYEKIALSPIHASGKPAIYHNCGYANNLYPCYKKLGITCWETVAQAPQGDNTIAGAKAFFGDSLVLCGTLDQVHFLKTASPEQVYEAAANTVRIGKPGCCYIFAASDYLEHATPLENVKAMISGALSESAY